ncbi:deoxyribose-phosphate aldolase [bacterium]|nr:deoxyribose-phosphate aldolase [bacterium]
MIRVEEIAAMIDHSLLHPTLNDAQLEAGCALAKKYEVASVCIKPYAVKLAAEWLQGSGVLVGTVVGFPHGNSAVEIKIAETENACMEGAREIDMVVNIGKVLSEDWDYIEGEIGEVLNTCHAHHAVLKVIFENDYLSEDRPKVRLCDICSRLKVDFVKTSTGYGFVKDQNGKYGYAGATDHDLKLMRKHCHPDVQVKAAGGVRTLDDALRVRKLGVTRIGASATADILDEAARRFGEEG